MKALNPLADGVRYRHKNWGGGGVVATPPDPRPPPLTLSRIPVTQRCLSGETDMCRAPPQPFHDDPNTSSCSCPCILSPCRLEIRQTKCPMSTLRLKTCSDPLAPLAPWPKDQPPAVRIRDFPRHETQRLAGYILPHHIQWNRTRKCFPLVRCQGVLHVLLLFPLHQLPGQHKPPGPRQLELYKINKILLRHRIGAV